MGDGRGYDGSNMTLLLQNERLPCSSDVLDSLLISNFSPSFHGSTSMFNFQNSPAENVTNKPLFSPLGKEENGNEDYDGCFHPPQKIRRLTTDQVQFLEKSFEVDNKLELERKAQLAKEIGLQPRQVAIWFQNRRARYKTKQLEKDYDSLKASYDKLKADYDCLFKENESLRNEVQLLTDKLLVREKGQANSEPSDTINPLDAEPQKLISNSNSQNVSITPMVVCRHEHGSSARSDVFDSDSPNYTDGNHSTFLEPANSSNVFEPELSDFSQDEEDTSILPPLCFPKLEAPPENSCILGFPVEDQAVWFWSY
ncbi:unnamed protein product [Ilex paraguariensis]|uniref:Homeobox-leucine zipper protein n=1 Tax=Ilex paraguariensis TaxID=185542 RepID=A0ABC8TXE4_9AQUA